MPQTLKISTKGLVSSFHGITKLNNGNYSAALKSTGDPSDLATAKALDALQQALSGLNNAIFSGELTTSALPTTTSSGVLEIALTTATTLVTGAYPTSVGDRLVVVLTQDATGGRQITWDAMFMNATVNIDTTLSTVSFFDFVGRITPSDSVLRWYTTAPPMLSQPL